ncbi:MAG: VOC family protein [Planctomycetes bacterium]|nr:VOC family protein [Planctomycetota bacterium]
MKKLTPVLIVDSVEAQLPFWCERLEFQVVASVPHEKALGFAILVQGGVELMLQSRASVAVDNPAALERPSHSTLFFEVEDLDRVRRALAGLPLVFDERETPYGARESCVRDPAGNTLVFAHFANAT